MKIADFGITEERVQEIAAEEGRHRNLTAAEKAVREDAINTASPEIARAVLLWAANECELNLHSELGTSYTLWNRGVDSCLIRLRNLAKEIEP